MSVIKYEVEVDEYGSRFWYLNDKLHREDGPAIEWANGDKYWYLNGKRHREDGPAVERPNGDKYWYLNGKRHREDGPAIEYANGDKFWFLNGESVSEEEHARATTNHKEITVAEIEAILGHKVKVVSEEKR